MLRNVVILSVFAVGAAFLPGLLGFGPDQAATFSSSGLGATQQRSSATPASTPASTPVEPSLSGLKAEIASDARGHYVADFKLNGSSVEAVVDTGATSVAINRSTARRIGISLSPNDFKYTVSTANGETKAAVAVIKRVQIGRISLDNVEAVVLEDVSLNTTLMGMAFLSRLDKYQVRDGVMLLQQ